MILQSSSGDLLLWFLLLESAVRDYVPTSYMSPQTGRGEVLLGAELFDQELGVL